MKINAVFCLITLAIGTLAGYGFYSWNKPEQYQLLIAAGSGLTISLYLGGFIALSSKRPGTVGNIRALSAVFLLLTIISNSIFSLITMAAPIAYIIVNGILLLTFMLAAYGTAKALE